MRSYEAAANRRYREENRRMRELERMERERERMSALEQARLEVEQYENRLEVLLSVHKECGQEWNWAAIAGALPPVPPARKREHESVARRYGLARVVDEPAVREAAFKKGSEQDEAAYQDELTRYESALEDWRRMRRLALRVLAGSPEGYIEALRECGVFEEIKALGSSMEFAPLDGGVMGVVLQVEGPGVIPEEVKSLTAGGKVSVKGMARSRFHEIYQDYICGCVLRVGREVLALLPVGVVLVTARVLMLEVNSGEWLPEPVLSVALDRDGMGKLNYARLDASDTVERFPNRCDFKASRKAGAFQRITPLIAEDLAATDRGGSADALLSAARQLRREIADLNLELAPAANTTEEQPNA